MWVVYRCGLSEHDVLPTLWEARVFTVVSRLQESRTQNLPKYSCPMRQRSESGVVELDDPFEPGRCPNR